MTEKEYNAEKKNVIEFIKMYRLSDEKLLHNLPSKDSISYLDTEKSLKYWDMVLTSLQLDPIEVEAAKLQKVYEEGYKKGKNEFFNFDAPLVKTGEAVSRQAVIDCFKKWQPYMATRLHEFEKELFDLPPVTPQPKTGRCKNCKYFEYDSLVKVDGVIFIVAHENCKKWGGGCKTREDGYCFMFEPKESEEP